MNNSHSEFHSSKRKDYLQNNWLWSKREEAGRGVAGGSHPELTEEFSQVLAIYSPPTNYPADLPVTLPSSETIPIRLTVSSVTSLPCWPARVIVSKAKGHHFGLSKLKRRTQKQSLEQRNTTALPDHWQQLYHAAQSQALFAKLRGAVRAECHWAQRLSQASFFSVLGPGSAISLWKEALTVALDPAGGAG